MTKRMLTAIAAAAIAAGISGCGEDKISNLTFSDIAAKAKSGDESAFVSYFKTISGQKVKWQGTVVEVAKEFEDDYVEVNYLLIDLDGDTSGQYPAEVKFRIAKSKSSGFKPDQKVSFVAALRETQWRDGNFLIMAEADRVE
ncbi:MAG: hypothetical protein GC191_10985 [Azospirillum sp.]|nr:hypothetical protein [Azospirillum sp.]